MSKNFVDGLRIYKPREKAPKWIIANCEIEVTLLRNWIAKNQQGEKIKFQIKLGQSGSYYAELDTYDKADELRKTQEPTDRLVGKEAEEVKAVRDDYNAKVQASKENDITPTDIPF